MCKHLILSEQWGMDIVAIITQIYTYQNEDQIVTITQRIMSIGGMEECLIFKLTNTCLVK